MKEDKIFATKKLVTNFKDNKKAFYGFVRSKQRVKIKVTQIRKTDKNLTQNDLESAEELSKFFQSVFVNEDTGEIPQLELRRERVQQLSTIEITREKVCNKLSQIQENKSPGPDGIHPKILKEMANVLDNPLTILFNKSLKEGRLPNEWKCANVVSIFKKGSRLEAGNYRPISLTSIPCKIMESIIRDRLMKHLKDNKLLTNNQHGFMNNRSCLTNLLETLEQWTQALDDGYEIDAIFLDYQKAFDTVPHRRLLSKLLTYGVDGDILMWIENFLTERKMRVIVNGITAKWTRVNSGVPQGSVLGPILFLLYVNELPDIVKSSIKMFADDTKIWKTLKTDADVHSLQEDLDTLEQWSQKWLLKFNIGKCKVMHLGKHQTDDYYLHEEIKLRILDTTDLEKDLGIWLSNDLK